MNNETNIIHPLSNVGMGFAPPGPFQVWGSDPSTPHPLSNIRQSK